MEQQNKENIQNIVENVVPVVQQPKQNNTLVIILSLLLLISISISSYFAYQTQTLIKELNEFKKLEQSTEVTIGSINPDNMENWKSYFNNEFDFELKIPSNLQIVEKPTTRIGDKISIYSSINNPESCRGDCHIIDSSETKVINGVTTRYLKGWWGEIGGSIAQSYASYVIPMKASYLIIQIQELPFDAKYIENRNIQPIDSKDLEQFNQIISTFKFTNPTTVGWKTYTDDGTNFLFKYPENWFLWKSVDGDSVLLDELPFDPEMIVEPDQVDITFSTTAKKELVDAYSANFASTSQVVTNSNIIFKIMDKSLKPREDGPASQYLFA